MSGVNPGTKNSIDFISFPSTYGLIVNSLQLEGGFRKEICKTCLKEVLDFNVTFDYGLLAINSIERNE